MKKFTLVCLATLIASASFGQKSMTLLKNATPSDKAPSKEVRMNARKSLASMREQLKANRVAVRKDFTPTVTTSITEPPAGEEHQNTILRSDYYYNIWGNIIGGTNKAGLGNYVMTDDAIYLRDPFSGFPSRTYLKLDKTADNEYVAHLPQAIYEEEYEGTTYQYYATKLRINDEGTTYIPDTLDDNTIDQDVRFVLDEDTLKAVDLDGEKIIGLTDNTYAWYGYGDFNYVLFDNPYTGNTVPDGATIEKWSLNGSELVNVAFVDNDVYVQDPVLGESGYWLKGAISGNKATFSGMQYMGVNGDYTTHEFFLPATYTTYLDDEGETQYIYTIADDIVFNYDKDAKKLTSAGDSTAFTFNGAPDEIYWITCYNDPVLKKFVEVAATPADPVITTLTPYDEEYGAGLMFELPAVDVDGNFIDPAKLYYNIYFDGSEEPETLSPDDYQNLTEEMTNVPYDFSDNYDFRCDGTTHVFYFYVAEYNNIGVSQTYTGGGETHRSNIVWATNPTSIKGVSSDSKSVKSVNYYDLSGRQVSAPAQGLYIKTITYTDGSKKNVKRMAK